MEEPTIPNSYHTFMRLIRRLQEQDPNAKRKVLKRRIIDLLICRRRRMTRTGTSLNSPICGRAGRAGSCSTTGSTWRCTGYEKKSASHDQRKSGSDR